MLEDLHHLAEDLRQYDQNRGLENRDIGDTLRDLQNELRDLSDFLHVPRPQHAEEGVQRSPLVEAQPIRVVDVDVVDPRAPRSQLSRASSSASSLSFLSSHHSEDWELYSRADSPPPWSHGTVSSSSSSEPSESSEPSFPSSISSPSSGPRPGSAVSSSPPLPPSSPSPSSSSSMSTIVPRRPPVDPVPLLGRIRDQVDALWDGQLSTNHLLDQLRDRPPPDNSELIDRMRRIEDLLRNLPTTVTAPIPQSELDSGSSTDGTDSRVPFWGPRGRRSPVAPHPIASAVGPSFAEQLENMLSASTTREVPPIQHPPPFRPFDYVPTGGPRPRSVSPVTTSQFAPRPATQPPPFPHLDPSSRGRRPIRHRGPVETFEPYDPEAMRNVPPSRATTRPVGEDDIDFQREQRNLRRQRDPRSDGFFHPGPPPQPVLVSHIAYRCYSIFNFIHLF